MPQTAWDCVTHDAAFLPVIWTYVRQYQGADGLTRKKLARLGQSLHVRPDYFFKQDSLKLVTKEYRSQSKLGKKPRDLPKATECGCR